MSPPEVVIKEEPIWIDDGDDHESGVTVGNIQKSPSDASDVKSMLNEAFSKLCRNNSQSVDDFQLKFDKNLPDFKVKQEVSAIDAIKIEIDCDGEEESRPRARHDVTEVKCERKYRYAKPYETDKPNSQLKAITRHDVTEVKCERKYRYAKPYETDKPNSQLKAITQRNVDNKSRSQRSIGKEKSQRTYGKGKSQRKTSKDKSQWKRDYTFRDSRTTKCKADEPKGNICEVKPKAVQKPNIGDIKTLHLPRQLLKLSKALKKDFGKGAVVLPSKESLLVNLSSDILLNFGAKCLKTHAVVVLNQQLDCDSKRSAQAHLSSLGQIQHDTNSGSSSAQSCGIDEADSFPALPPTAVTLTSSTASDCVDAADVNGPSNTSKDAVLQAYCDTTDYDSENQNEPAILVSKPKILVRRPEILVNKYQLATVAPSFHLTSALLYTLFLWLFEWPIKCSDSVA